MHMARGTSNLRILFGNTIQDQAEYFTVDEMNHFLMSPQAFDVVITDVSAYWDNAATLCALRRADSRIVVTTKVHCLTFRKMLSDGLSNYHRYLELQSGDYQSVIVHPPWRIGGFQVKDICKELGVPFIGELRLSEGLLSQLDSGMLDEWLAQDEQGKRPLIIVPASDFIQETLTAAKVEIRIQPWYKKL